jgi:acetoacetyl-CoA synthetase
MRRVAPSLPKALPSIRFSRRRRGHGVITDGDGLRRELQAICEGMLDVSPIAWSDDLLDFGADSLTVLNLLLEIEHYTGQLLPLSVFLSAPSIEGLATVLSSGAESVAAQQAPQSGPHLRPASKDDVEPICRFLEEAFPRVKAAAWCRLFDHRWSDHGRGFVLLDGNAVVGFVGLIAARRQVNGEAALVCNVSSWAVHPKYRGWGMALLAAALQEESLTYSAFTPGPTAWAALLAQRFTPLDSHRIVIPPMLQAETLFGPNRPVINFDPVAVRERLTGQQRQIFDDHAPYDCLQFTVATDPIMPIWWSSAVCTGSIRADWEDWREFCPCGSPIRTSCIAMHRSWFRGILSASSWRSCAGSGRRCSSRRRASFRSGHGACWSRCAPVIAPRSSRPTT